MTHYIIFAIGQNSKGPEFGKASPGALFLTLLLLGGIGFLIASMNKHLRISRKRFLAEQAAANLNEHNAHNVYNEGIDEVTIEENTGSIRSDATDPQDSGLADGDKIQGSYQ